jgi:hypothetical protein
MTRLPPSGAASFALQEGALQKGAPRVPTIEKLLVDLKLEPMSSEKVAEIRGRLRIVVGSWWQEIGQFIGSDGRLDVESVVASLMKAAQGLEEANAVLKAIEGGIQRAENFEAVSRIKKVLSRHPKIGKSSEDYISSASEIAETISHTCRVAAQMLRSEERKRGRPSHHWYKDFTKILCDIARENRIKATLENDRVTGKPKGRFLELAVGFERLFPREMRSPSPEALAKRLSGPLRQIRTASAKGQRDK